jgi:tRNA pseudouridine32 synthase/23S rRNA pseudouridine746 synthase
VESGSIIRGRPPEELRGYCKRCASEHAFANDVALAFSAITELFRAIEHESSFAAIREALASSRGKMIGVLVAHSGEVLRGYSGELAGRRDWPDWVGPVLKQSDTEELQRRTVQRIEALDEAIAQCDVAGAEARLLASRAELRQAKRLRQESYLAPAGDNVTQARRAQVDASEAEQTARRALASERERLQKLRAERRAASQVLSTAMFDAAKVTNARGDAWSLREVFAGPAIAGGTTDCTVPKLLEAANVAGLRPLALAEAWWGTTINGRHHGDIQLPCERKCQPVLGHLLCGA